MPRYVKNAGAVFSLQYHLVWCPKYRRKVLVGAVAERLHALLLDTARLLDMHVVALEIMPDHVHLLVGARPEYAPAELVRRFKGATSRTLRVEFPHLERQLPTMWSRSYYAGSVGAMSEQTVRRYIEQQRTR